MFQGYKDAPLVELPLLSLSPSSTTTSQKTNDTTTSETTTNNESITASSATTINNSNSIGVSVIDAAVKAGLFPTKAEARRNIANGGLYVNRIKFEE